MATRELLSPAQRLRLTELPDPMDEREMARHHTLSDRDLAVNREAPATGHEGGVLRPALLLALPRQALEGR